MIKAKTIEISVTMRLKFCGEKYLYWVWSNTTGLKVLKSAKNDEKQAQRYVDDIGEKMFYRNMADFGEYQNWGGEWKPACNIF